MIVRRRAARPAPARLRRAGALLIAAGTVTGLLSSSSAVGADVAPPAGRVEVIELSGILDRTAADFLLETIAAAEAGSSTAVVVQLDTPGGVGVSMEDVTDAITASSVPVVVWVGPPAAQAVGAGAFVAHAAHVLSMAPGAVLGAASPSDLSEASAPAADEKLLVDLAELRGRDQTFASAAALHAAAIVVSAAPFEDDQQLPAAVDPERAEILDDEELARLGVDFTAATLPDVLRELDGRQVLIGSPAERSRTETISLDATAVQVRFHSPGLVRRILHTAANPALAYLLVMAGALAIVFELFQPGFGVAGVTGAALLGLGLYGLAVLPVSWLAFAVLLLGVILLVVDLALAGFGALTLAGAAALGAGSFWLFTGPAPVRAPIWLIASVVLASLVFFVVIMTTVLRAQASPALGAAGLDLVGQIGTVRSVLNPEGHVFVGGALWRARADGAAGRLRTGTAVRVTDLDDSGTLLVEQTGAQNLEESANR